ADDEAVMIGAHRRDPITDESFFFETKKEAEIYLELAVTYLVSFREIYRMAMTVLHGPEAMNDNFDLHKELRLLSFEGEQDAELLKFDHLPPEELIEIWMRSRRALQRIANFPPHRREKIEAFLDESEVEMIAMLERHERKER